MRFNNKDYLGKTRRIAERTAGHCGKINNPTYSNLN